MSATERRARMGLRAAATRWRQRRLLVGALQAVAAGVAVGTAALALTGHILGGTLAGMALALLAYAHLERQVPKGDVSVVAAAYLDDRFLALEDSTSLLLDPKVEGLGALQRQRVAKAFNALPEQAVHEALPARGYPTLLAVAAAASLGAIMLRWPPPLAHLPSEPPPVTQAAPSWEGLVVHVTPPAYTGLEAVTLEGPEVEVPEGAVVRFELAVEGAPRAMTLHFDDGQSLALKQHEHNRWVSPPWPVRTSAYHVVADPPWAEPPPYLSLRARVDRAPSITISSPQDTVVEFAAGGEDEFPVEAILRDDYGLGTVRARLTLASGGGENVRFRERSEALSIEPSAQGRQAVARYDIDLAALELEPGDELYVRLEAHDNRLPQANVGRSRTLILRWLGEPAAAGEDVGQMAMRVLPEYFRSQRQIIIDTQALEGARPELTEAESQRRSQGIAFDQKALRLRYGTFLGEEAVTDIGPGGHQHGLPGRADEPVHFPGDGHDHSGENGAFASGSTSVFGRLDAVLDRFGHAHDAAEQATLFDPETRELLRGALGNMWLAELQLRLGNPSKALPFEYEALDLIKRVQQRSRVYLARVGFRPTPPEEGRRASGEVDDVARARRVERPGRDASSPRAIMHRALASLLPVVERGARARSLPLPAELADRLRRVLRGDEAEDAASLVTLGALEALVADPTCERCAAELAAGLLRALPLPEVAAQAPEGARTPIAAAYEASGAGGIPPP